MDSYSGIKFEEYGLSVSKPVKHFIRTFENDKLVRLHYHNSLEINICRNVNGVIRLGEGIIDLGLDHLIILPPGTPHSYRFSACDGKVEVFHIMIDSFPGAAEAASGLLDFRVILLDDCSPDALNNLYSIYKADSGRAAVYGHLLLFLSLIAAGTYRIETSTDRFLRRVIDYVEANFSEKISLDDVSVAAGMSRYHFCRKFKERTGENWTDYLKAVRLSHAEKKLLSGSTILKTAESSGFESDSYFIKCFRQQYGMTPLTWKQERLIKLSGGAPD